MEEVKEKSLIHLIEPWFATYFTLKPKKMTTWETLKILMTATTS